MKRGDVVIVDFSQYDPSDKVRPALVIQSDRDNARMQKTIVATITGNTHRAGEDSQYLIESAHADYGASGLYRPSCVNCSNLYTVRQADIARVIGSLAPATMAEIDVCLKNALGIA